MDERKRLEELRGQLLEMDLELLRTLERRARLTQDLARLRTGTARYSPPADGTHLQALEKAVAAKPDFANAHYLLGMACFNQNKKGPAKEHFEKYLELDPNGKEAATVKELLPLLK